MQEAQAALLAKDDELAVMRRDLQELTTRLKKQSPDSAAQPAMKAYFVAPCGDSLSDQVQSKASRFTLMMLVGHSRAPSKLLCVLPATKMSGSLTLINSDHRPCQGKRRSAPMQTLW